MKIKLKPNIKRVINVITTVLLVVIVVISLVQNTELNAVNNDLRNNIKSQEEIIIDLIKDNENLSGNIISLNENIANFETANSQLQENNKLLESKIQELEAEISKLKNNNTTSSRKDFKSFMPYDAITSKSSMQWRLQQQATTNEDGIRCIDGIPMVAVGTGWGLKVGDIAIVTCENGNSFKVMVGDIKANKHTDAENKTTIFNGCRCEFIVDKSALDPMVRKMGNIATLDKYKGYVVNIEKA